MPTNIMYISRDLSGSRLDSFYHNPPYQIFHNNAYLLILKLNIICPDMVVRGGMGLR
jgi:hypothetical protein